MCGTLVEGQEELTQHLKEAYERECGWLKEELQVMDMSIDYIGAP